MEVLGFSGEDQDSIFRILASILHLGNVYFEKYEVREHMCVHLQVALCTYHLFATLTFGVVHLFLTNV